MKIFVYGTLKSLWWNNSVMRDSPCLGRFVTKPRYDLVEDHGLPFLLPTGEFGVWGETYEVGVDVLQELDYMEGHPDWYRRDPVELTGGPEDVLAYFMPKHLGSPVRPPLGEDGAIDWQPWYEQGKGIPFP